MPYGKTVGGKSEDIEESLKKNNKRRKKHMHKLFKWIKLIINVKIKLYKIRKCDKYIK